MKVGLIINRLVGARGGLERYTSGLVAELVKAGHQVHVFAHDWDATAENQGGLVLHRVPVLRGLSFARELSFALACRRLVTRTPCDLVFSLERTVKQDIFRAGAGCHREWLAQRRRYLSRVQRGLLRLNPLHLTLLWLERQTFSPANTRLVIANSHRGKAEIVRHYAFPAERIFVIHNGVDGARFRPRPRPGPPGEFVMLFVGSGFARKGLEYCVRVLPLLPAPVRLRVAGRDKPFFYQRLARRLGVAGRVEFLGSVSPIEDFYCQGDLLLHPAIYEPFSNACLEALACGLPVITSRNNGVAEILAPGQNGAVVDDPADLDRLAAAIRPFLDPVTRAAASVHARQTAQALPFDRNVRQTLELFAKVKEQGGINGLMD
jgi:UDP-glucose:(heptosyl)LPS alpha-1,3-glucosyltransferase